MKRKAAERLADLIDPDRALRELARLGYSDIRGLFGDDGRLLQPHEWSDEAAAAVASIEVSRERTISKDTESIVTEMVTKVRSWDKTRALEMIAKHLGLLRDRLELTGKGGGPVELGVQFYVPENGRRKLSE